ncbi:MAG: response regulator [Paludibacteraceae bacterium]|nr:response regulator [Paludibacteraceae bacterium]
MKKFLTLLVFCMSTFDIQSQIGIFYSTDKDISNSLINHIYQDKRNYLWIATEDGLNKYDGIKFTVYKNEPKDSTSLKNNYVRCLFEDSKNRFWVGCINGLQQFNRQTNQFEEIKLLSENNQSLCTHITSIIESKDGNIWISTSGEGVLKNSKDQDHIFKSVTQINSRLLNQYLTFIFQDSSGKFWIGSENYGLNLYDPQQDKMYVFNVQSNNIGSNQISAITEDSNKNIFVGTLSGGLYKFNKNDFSFVSIRDANGNNNQPVKTIFFDKSNRLLVGTDGQGLKTYNYQKNLLEDMEIKSAPFDFSKTKVHSILQDKAGNLWFGLFQKGIFLVRNNPYAFNYIGHKSFSQNLIGSNSIAAIYEDKSKALWVGTDNDGMYKLENNHKKSIHYIPPSVPNIVSSIVEIDNGEMWLGSFSQGLACFDKNTGRSTYFNNIPSSFQYNNLAIKINCMIKDQNNHLWIGTHGGGLFVFDPSTRKYIKHFGSDVISNDWISSLFMDKDQRIWIGTYKGFSIIDLKNLKILNHESPMLENAVIYAITQDENENMWIGTTEGLYVMNKTNNKFTKYIVENGLPNNVICGIVEDAQKNLWISTHNGLSKFNRKENTFINYYNSDGLQGNEFYRGVFFKSITNDIYFGGISGITYFNPLQIKEKREKLQIYLIALNIGDRTVFCDNTDKTKRAFRFISDLDTLHLDYKDNIFNLEFSTFNFGIPEQISYRYKMEGLNNNDWLYTEPGVNRIHFTNINYGTYKLKVSAFVHDTFSPVKELTIIISPPWYLSWQAITLYVVVFLLILYGIFRYIRDRINYRHELLRQRHQEEINEAKFQYFTNISHDIRTPMSLIISPLEKLMTNEPDSKKRNIYQIMYRNANRILRLINQMMDVRKIDNGQMTMKFQEVEIVAFIEDLMKTFEYNAKKNHIDFKFIHEEEKLNVWIDTSNFDKVMMNLLSNAFKFTPANGSITITLKTFYNTKNESILKNYFEIVVADSGIGVREEDKERIFDRFYQCDNIVSNQKNTGTGVGLHLSRSLINLMHGNIFVRNRENGIGSEFVVQLQLGNKHLSAQEIVIRTDQIDINQEKINEKSVMFLDNDGNSNVTKIKSKTKFQVLIVEDDDEIRNYLRDELSSTFKIKEATNGKEALKMVFENHVDVVISDIMMPEMDGIALCRKIKTNLNINHIPVILLTARTTDMDKAEGLDVGADAYVIKPFNVELLVKQILNLIENRNRLEIKPLEEKEMKELISPEPLPSFDQVFLEKIVKIIKENISNSDLNVEFLADRIGMSRVQLYRRIKELTTQSPSDFIKTIRIKQAAELLTQQKANISEIAYSVGFSNLSHFSNSFKEFYGISPSEYAFKNRNNHLF